MTEKLNGFYSRKLRRAIAKAEGQPFEPIYNGKGPITKAEYEANNGKPKPVKVGNKRKYGAIKAVLPKKAKVTQ